nr:hypothetical protein [Paracoccaceae bacterium]
MSVGIDRAKLRRGQATHRGQQGRAPSPANRRQKHRRQNGRAREATQRDKSLAQCRVGNAKQPAQFVARAAGRNQPGGAGQNRRQAGGVGQRPVGGLGQTGAPGEFALAPAPPRRPPRFHRPKVAQRPRHPGQHAVVAEV